MKINTILLVLLLLSVAGCGSFEDERGTLLSSNQNKDLVNSFEISKDQAEHFQVTEAKVEEVKAPVKPTAPKEEKKDKKKEKVEKSTKVKQSVATEEKAKTVVEPAHLDSSYPSDYPQELKDYDVKSKPLYEQARHIFFQGEQSIMAISYLGVTAGYITITSKNLVKLGEKIAYHYYARFKSKDAYRYFYWLDDNIETFIEKSTLLPIKYSLFQREKKQNVDDLQLFDFKKLKTFHWYKRVKEGNNKDEKIENYIPRFTQDSFSALQFVRGLPMKKNDHYEFPVSTRGKAWLLTADVIGEETVTIMNKEIKAIKLRCETHFPGVLQKSGDINFWYSADEARRLLKFQAKVKIGSINGELVEYTPGTPIK